MKRIRDLISMPEVETVIQVSSAEEMDEGSLKEKIVDSFVITDDILQMLESIYFSLKRGERRGVLLRGNYGSGKSHFLAFLSAMFKYPAMLGPVERSFPELAGMGALLAEKKSLPVSVTLTDFPASSSLAEIIAEKISYTASRAGIAETIWDPARVVSDFRRVLLPGLGDEYNAYLKSAGLSDPGSSSNAAGAGIIINFLKERKIPFRFFYDYQDIFDNIEKILAASHPGGIFLLVDELSEFLRARNRGDLVSEDIRFIQFLGEKSGRSRLGVVFSMQEAIEEVADVSTDGLNRIKDRYPIRINLTAVHLRELVGKRLLPKTADSAAHVDDVYLSLVDSFPGWHVSREDFRAIYPVHPDTFRLLEGITGLFSKTRGMVDFIYTRIKGDPGRGIAGIMEESADTLLYPDVIFDHFRANLEESIEYNKLLKNIFASIERDIPDIFDGEVDRRLALRLVRLILLFQILPEAGKPSARELAHLVMESRFRLDPEYNYKFIREKILKRLENRTAFLGVERGADPLDDRFFLLHKESPAAIFESRVKQFTAKNHNAGRQALWFFISRLKDPELPLGDMKDNDRSVHVKFENTIREGIVRLGAIDGLTNEERAGIEEALDDEHDFILFIGYPAAEDRIEENVAALRSSIGAVLKNNIFYWKPAVPGENDIAALLDCYARIRVYEESVSGGGNLNDANIENMIKDAEAKASRAIKNLYGRGAVYSVKNDLIVRNDILLTSSFERSVQLFAVERLKASFPSHSRVMPAFEIASAETYRQIINLFREKGEVDFNFEGSMAMKSAVDALLKNSALLKNIHNYYTVSPEPSRNVFIKDLLFYIEQNPGTFGELYKTFRKGAYGIKKEIFTIYLFFLAFSGFITLERGGRILKPDRLDPAEIESADCVKTGEGLSPLFIERYQALEPFTEGLSSKNIHLQTQRSVWEKIVLFKKENEEQIRTGFEWINRVESAPPFKDNPLSAVRESYGRLIVFLSAVMVSKQSREGFDALFESLPSDFKLSRDMEMDRRFRPFCSNDLDRINFIYGYLTDPGLFTGGNRELADELMLILGIFSGMDGLIAGSKTGVIFERFNDFREKYKINYLKAHRDIHSKGIADEFERIKLAPSYRVLSALAKIENISVKDDLIRIDSMIRSAQASVCRRPVSSELDLRPYCACGLRRGEIQAGAEEILAMTKAGVRQYLAALQEGSNSGKISRFAAAVLAPGDGREREILKEILNVDIEKTTDNDLIRVITGEAVALVNRGLSGNIRVVKKKVRDFYNAVFGRRFRREDIAKIFNDWLSAEAPHGEDILYEIADFDENKAGAVVPSVLSEEIGRAVGIDDERSRTQAFAAAMLLRDLPPAETVAIIRKICFVDISNRDLGRAFELAENVCRDGFDFGTLFSEGDISEITEALGLGAMKPADIGKLFDRARFFNPVRERITALCAAGEIKIPAEIRAAMRPDDTPHRRILDCVIEIDGLLKKYYSRSGSRDGFSRDYFLAVFRLYTMTGRIISLSLNNGILTGLIPARYSEMMSGIANECAGYFNENIDAWEKEFSLRVGSVREKIAPGPAVIVIMDSLRTDLFLEMDEAVKNLPSVKRKSLDLLIAPLPTDTASFRSELFSGIDLESGNIFDWQGRSWVFIAAGERDYKRERLGELLKDDNAGIILSFSILDEKIHSTKQGIDSLAEEMSVYYKNFLIPVINSIPAGRSIYIVSDHGFIENKSYGRKEQKRYTHGGNTFLERIVPFAVYKRSNVKG